MTVYLTLDPVSDAIYTALHVAGLLALCPGGVMDDVDQAQTYASPFLLYEVRERAIGGLGTRAGRGRLMEVTLRLHVFTAALAGGFLPSQRIMAKAIELLVPALAVVGYKFAGEPFHDSTMPFTDVEVAGVKVKELVGEFRLYLEEV